MASQVNTPAVGSTVNVKLVAFPKPVHAATVTRVYGRTVWVRVTDAGKRIARDVYPVDVSAIV